MRTTIFLFSSSIVLIFGLIEVVLLRLLHKDWWQLRWIRWSAIGLPLIGVAGVGLWLVGEYNSIYWLVYPGAVAAVIAFVLEVCLMLSLPFSGLLAWINRFIDRRAKRRTDDNAGTFDSRRRVLLKAAAAALPLATLTLGVSGVGRSMGSALVYRRPMTFENLPPALDGLRILHISDLHLRHYIKLPDLEEILLAAEKFTPDLVVITGDIADDLSMLGDALKLTDQLGAPLGAYASLGNHEYFRGVQQVRRIADTTPVPLLVDTGLMLPTGRGDVYLGAIDDPRRMREIDVNFFRAAVDRAMQNHTGDAFSIVMSHRPDALDAAAEAGVDLTLAGHTHGGQMGVLGRSVFEPMWPHRYLWGPYARGKSQLYTSSGAGHWFPFRLGCPPEAPVIELRRA